MAGNGGDGCEGWLLCVAVAERSLPSPGYSIWNPWNEYWLGPQPVSYSMDIMDSMWNDHGMVMEWLIPHGIQPYSTWIPLDSIWNLCISTLDSMDKSIWIPWKIPYGFHGQVHVDSMEDSIWNGNPNSMEFQGNMNVKKKFNIENRTLNSTTDHMITQVSAHTAIPYNR